jgi:hypothetical protein
MQRRQFAKNAAAWLVLGPAFGALVGCDDAATKGDAASSLDAASLCSGGAQDTPMTDQHPDPHHIPLTMGEVLAATDGDYSIKACPSAITRFT